MADYTTPVTATVGQPRDVASDWNVGVRDNMEFLARRPMCRLTATVTQTFATATFADVLFDSEDIDDPAGQHSTASNTGRIVCVTPGWYEFKGLVGFAANATGNRFLRVRRTTAIGGATADYRIDTGANVGGTDSVHLGGSVAVLLPTAGDYVTLQARQDSGGNLLTSVTEGRPMFSAHLIRLV